MNNLYCFINFSYCDQNNEIIIDEDNFRGNYNFKIPLDYSQVQEYSYLKGKVINIDNYINSYNPDFNGLGRDKNGNLIELNIKYTSKGGNFPNINITYDDIKNSNNIEFKKYIKNFMVNKNKQILTNNESEEILYDYISEISENNDTKINDYIKLIPKKFDNLILFYEDCYESFGTYKSLNNNFLFPNFEGYKNYMNNNDDYIKKYNWIPVKETDGDVIKYYQNQIDKILK